MDIVGKAKVTEGNRLVGITVGIDNGRVREGNAVGRFRLNEGRAVGRLKLRSRDGRAVGRSRLKEGSRVGRPKSRDGTDSVGNPAKFVKIPL